MWRFSIFDFGFSIYDFDGSALRTVFLEATTKCGFRFLIFDFRFHNAHVNEADFKLRTRRFALRVVKVVQAMSRDAEGEVLGRHLLRSGTSVGANYRAACRAKSRADMIAKLGTVEEEADETLYWLERVIDAGLFHSSKLDDLMREGEEILSMIVASRKTLRSVEATKS